MNLIKAVITGFRSISDSQIIELERDQTCLIGKSESGKSNILKAIHFAFHGNSLDKADRNAFLSQESIYEVVILTFELTDKDRENLNKLGGPKATTHLNLKKSSDGKRVIEILPPLESESRKVFSEDYISFRQPARTRLRKYLRKLASLDNSSPEFINIAKNIVDLDIIVNKEKILDILEYRADSNLEARIKTIPKMIEGVRKMLPRLIKGSSSIGLKSQSTRLIHDFNRIIELGIVVKVSQSALKGEALLRLLPECIFLVDDDLTRIQNSIKVTDFIANPSKYPFYNSLFQLADVDLTKINRSSPVECEVNSGRMAKNLANIIKRHWTQEKIEFTAKIGPDEIVLLIAGEEEHLSTPDARSEGLRWYLSFIFRHLATARNENILVLADEPGLHLHASGQKDLLAMFYSLAGKVQFVYTTHSPYLLPKSFPQKIRSINKAHSSDPERKITKVNNKPYHSKDGRAWEPIRTAIGIGLGDSLFLGEKNILVEGITDQYYLTAFVHHLNSKHGTIYGFDNTTIIPFNSNRNDCLALIRLLEAQGVGFRVLLDSDQSGKRIENFLVTEKVDKKYIISTSLSSLKEIEECFSYEYFIKVVEQTHEETKLPGSPIDLKKLSLEGFTEADIKAILKADEHGWTYYLTKLFAKKNGRAFDKVLVSTQIISDFLDQKEPALNAIPKIKPIIDALMN